jgi:hypothetical protein
MTGETSTDGEIWRSHRIPDEMIDCSKVSFLTTVDSRSRVKASVKQACKPPSIASIFNQEFVIQYHLAGPVYRSKAFSNSNVTTSTSCARQLNVERPWAFGYVIILHVLIKGKLIVEFQVTFVAIS